MPKIHRLGLRVCLVAAFVALAILAMIICLPRHTLAMFDKADVKVVLTFLAWTFLCLAGWFVYASKKPLPTPKRFVLWIAEIVVPLGVLASAGPILLGFAVIFVPAAAGLKVDIALRSVCVSSAFSLSITVSALVMLAKLYVRAHQPARRV